MWNDFLTNNQLPIHKWTHYIPVYEKFLARYRNRTCTVLEIGCGQGGSLQMWKRYLGPYAQIIGLDINKECKMYEEAQIIVEIGSQNDEEFLKYVVNTYGMFDVVIDDGSHMMGDILKSFGMLFKNVTKDGVYIVEDLHTAYWDEYGGGLHRQESFIEFTKRAIDALHSHYIRGEYTQEELLQEVAGYTRSITIIDSMVAFEKGRGIKKSAPRIGRTEPISNILDELTF